MMGDDKEKDAATAEGAEAPAPEARRRRIIPAKSDAPPPPSQPPAPEPPKAEATKAAPAKADAPKADAPKAGAAKPAAKDEAPKADAAPASSKTEGSAPRTDVTHVEGGPTSSGGRRFDVRSPGQRDEARERGERERRVARSAATASREAFRPAPATEEYPESYDGMPRRPTRTGGPGSAFSGNAFPGSRGPSRGGRPPRGGPRPPRTDRDGPRDAPRGPDSRGGAPPSARAPEKSRPQAPPPPRSQPAAPPPKPAAPPKPKLDVTLLGVPQAKVKDRQASQKPALTPKQALAARAQARAPGAMAKPAPSSRAERPDAGPLAEAWLGADAEGALDALKQAGGRAEALIDAWLKAQNVEAIAVAADADGLPGGARKAARRAANVLKARGIALPERARKARFDEGGESTFEATYSPSDGMGTSVYTVVERDPGGRCHIAEIVVREPIGILRAGAGWLSRSQLKEGRERASDAAGSPPVVVPLEWARYRIAKAKAMNETSKQLLPLGLDGCKPLIEPVPETEPVHPVQDLVAAVDAEPMPDVTGSDMLHNENEFRSWLPDRRALDEMLRKLGAALGAQGGGDPKVVDEKLAEETKAATDRFFSPEVRAIIVQRMQDATVSIRHRAGDDTALRVLRVARAVRDAGLITQPPQDIPFLVTFFQKGVALLAQQGGGALRIPVAGSPPSQAAEGG